MNNLKFISSNETKIDIEKVALSGFVHACRNLGNVTFFILQDTFGMIQIVWQRSILEAKITDLIIEKKIYILGRARLREQKATSITKINNLIEIDAEDCFILDSLKKGYSLLTETKQILSLYKEKRSDAFISKKESFDQEIFNSLLIAKLRSFMQEVGFLEIPAIYSGASKKNKSIQEEDSLRDMFDTGFNRNFYFTQKEGRAEMRVAIAAFCLAEVIEQANQILKQILTAYGWNALEALEVITAENCLSNYGSLEPDFRFSFGIQDAKYLLNDEFYFTQKNARFLSIPNLAKSEILIEKIIDFVREQTGLSISYLISHNGEMEGPLKKYVKSSLNLGNSVLFFASCDSLLDSLTVLGEVYQYLRKYNLGIQKKHAANWISKSNAVENMDFTYLSLIFNGQKIASCIFESYPSSYLNRGFIVFDLSSLDLSKWKEKERKKSTSRSKVCVDRYLPPQKIPLKIPDNELQAAIAINDDFERKQVISLLNMDHNPMRQSWEKIRGLIPALNRFEMSVDDAIFLIGLIPEKINSLLDLPENEIFQYLWSLLGHKHVIEFLRDEQSKKIVQTICNLQIIMDYKQLLFLDLKTIYLVGTILEIEPEKADSIARSIKILLNSSPNDFSNLIECLSGLIKFEKSLDFKNLSSTLFRASKLGLSTPGFFNFFIKNEKNEKLLTEFLALIRSLHSIVFPNCQIEQHSFTDIFIKKLRFLEIEFHVTNDTFYEIIYYLFKPLNMSFYSFKKFYSLVLDRTVDFSQNGISFEGKNWDKMEKCYIFGYNQHGLRIYPSKNCASFFAKASSGICTGVDLKLFQRSDHFHLNLISSKERRVIGNVQAYILANAQKKALLIRGINPSASYLDTDNLSLVVNAVLEAAIQIAEGSRLDQVLLCPSLGIWHVESSRKEIIGALQILCKELPIVNFDKPYLLFHFATQDKCIDFAYLLWARECNSVFSESFNDNQLTALPV